MSNIASSIQDYCKKINSRLTGVDILSLLVTALFIIGLALVIEHGRGEKMKKIVYKEASTKESSSLSVNLVTKETRDNGGFPFGSRKGKTYTFSWCRSSSMIKSSNKMYFSSVNEAEKAGRTLSKFCKK